ncbi:paraslipin [Trichocoleus sp. FACHB-591]|uniref:SPFH domain-containing protein n=1 Tax=Trichocoleus sp. FACHB-591 TaxID=2692872 RepID=UPI001685EC91|nr:stomatin-like protein [Trichocoleus sp. FACHB-591]MBD2095071.1 paraslipin [Trichocoleus sp. FACHB-591]
MESILAALALVIVGYTVGSVKIINQGNEALVERLGRYHRKLTPGLNFIVPFVDSIVLEDTVREQVLDVEPQEAITKDNVALKADAVVYWRILELERAFYSVEDVELGIKNLVLTTLRSALGQMKVEDTYSSRSEINQTLLHQLDEATAAWGVKVTRVEVQNISPPPSLLESMAQQRAAEIRKRASISEAEGTVESMRLIAKALQAQPNTSEVLKYLIAQRYVEANEKISESPNSKVIFMDPKALSEALENLMETPTAPDGFDPGLGGGPGNGASS